MLKFGLIGPDKKSAKFYGVSHMDTSFKNLIGIYFMKMDFVLWTWSKYLDMNLNLI